MENQSVNIKKTALNAIHHDLGGKMTPFAGYEMPVQYAGVNHEHETVRNAVGVFDVSHMGEILIQGKDALALIQKISSNDASKLFPGKIQYSCMPNKTGGIVDDLLIYMMSEKDYLLVVNASNIQKDWDWISTIALDYLDLTITNLSDIISLLAVQGPLAAKSLQKLTSINLNEMKYYTFEIGEFAGIPNAIVSATGYTGAGGFEIYVQNKYAELLWDAIFEAGKEYNIEPIGLAARDTLRLEMGYCLYGNDINDTTSPLEAGLEWITKFTKEFIQSDSLKIQKENGVTRKLVGFEMTGKGIPRHAYEIWDENQQIIGTVTSGTMSPTLKKAVGMGYVTAEKSNIGSEIFINIRNKPVKAIIVQTPFVQI
ncbi:aminomethyltransferase [Flavobacterium johnsoniae]|uniref:Aminomethyltransferase n=1 Tax=Flavobacterium johnsoniae (strain ATCC 17061 / DSM 2064 / JCM 8514 / BCRC 14874 / CCUG 350202 / NBRC 14942 / NCIMB 11054 / UW101) TaxID=376686 RepID=A5FBH2_FLAJ1|nr:aminomethyltransferase [Flavobacterium johnsoniae UW101]SHL12586.1 aminomethyltransferase [Flavobacterium johnsoniae]